MNSDAPVAQPPKIAAWLLSAFALEGRAEVIQGDLGEEFSVFASKSGIAAARRWYWKQTMQAMPHLFWNGVRAAPFVVAIATIAGFIFLRFAERLPQWGISAVVNEIPGYYENHFQAWTFWVTYGIAIGIILVETLVGCLIALAVRGKEVVVTGAVGLLGIFVVTIPYFVWFSRSVTHWPSYARLDVSHPLALGFIALLNAFGGSFFPVVGGGIIRSLRMGRQRVSA